MRISDWSSDVCSSDLDHVSGHRHEADDRIEAELPAGAGHGEGALQHALHRLDTAPDRNRIVAERKLVFHAPGGILSCSQCVPSVLPAFAAGTYLGSHASGIKGCQPQALGEKPLTLPRTSDQRIGVPNGTKTLADVSSASASVSSAARSAGAAAFSASATRASASFEQSPLRAAQERRLDRKSTRG